MTKVLIVDDSKEFKDTVLQTLKDKSKHEFFWALNGQEGLDLLINKPHIVFSDFNMPGMNGYEFTSNVNKEYPDTIIISIGDFPDNMKDFITRSLNKPVRYKTILSCIENYC